jgi:hypothetical protein
MRPIPEEAVFLFEKLGSFELGSIFLSRDSLLRGVVPTRPLPEATSRLVNQRRVVAALGRLLLQPQLKQ